MELQSNSFLYETLLQRAQMLARRGHRSTLAFIERVAEIAYLYHPGRFADGALENIPFRLGSEHCGSQPLQRTDLLPLDSRGSRTLHVASTLYSVGGHSRVLAKWVELDLSSSHAIVLTRQRGPVPEFVGRILESRGAALTQLRAEDPIEVRASQLRSLSNGFDRVILHTHPDDAVPVLAYAQPGGCPVAMFNHAHFSFSLGSSVSDVIINTLPYYKSISERHRFARRTALLRVPAGLVPLKHGSIDKRAAKTALGLSPQKPVGMTVALEQYFRPMQGYEFFRTLQTLMGLLPDLQFLVVGVSEESRIVPAELKRSDRLHLLGPVEDPLPFYRAADVFLESFPMPSLGAVIESVAYGEAFPVPVYGSVENIVRMNLNPVLSYEFRPQTEEEYLSYICRLLNEQSDTRDKAAALRRKIVEYDEKFGDEFPRLYSQIDGLNHEPREIPTTQCCMEEDNLILASFTEPNIGKRIDDLLPLRPGLAAHAKAVLRGHETLSSAVNRIALRGYQSSRKKGSIFQKAIGWATVDR